MKMAIDLKQIRSILKRALDEDIKSYDLTSEILIPKDLEVKAEVILKEPGVIAGLGVIQEIFRITNKNIKFIPKIKDGTLIRKITSKKGRVIAELEGKARAIFAAERTALNFLSHLSGVATLTNKFVKKVKNYQVKIIDTRKTTPNLRYLEKYAVRAGGGYNHRMGLYDAVLIKDNHIKALGIAPAGCVKIAKSKSRKPVEIEVKRLSEFKDTLKVKPDIIMLDNMSVKDVKKAIKIKKDYLNKNERCPLIEVSGNVNLSNVRKIAACGVDFISIGALTHSNQALDITLKVV